MPTKVYDPSYILAPFWPELVFIVVYSKTFVAAANVHMICSIVSVVDDDPMVRDSTVDLLNSYGYTALSFDSAEEFINSGEVKNTYCVITDQQLPGLSGTDLQNYLRAAGYRTPVIFITAYHVPAVRERAMAAGAIAYLTKPFDDAVLLDCLQTALAPAIITSGQRRF